MVIQEVVWPQPNSQPDVALLPDQAIPNVIASLSLSLTYVCVKSWMHFSLTSASAWRIPTQPMKIHPVWASNPLSILTMHCRDCWGTIWSGLAAGCNRLSCDFGIAMFFLALSRSQTRASSFSRPTDQRAHALEPPPHTIVAILSMDSLWHAPTRIATAAKLPP